MYYKIARHYTEEDERVCENCIYDDVPQVNFAVSSWEHSVTIYGEPCNSCKRTKDGDERRKAPDRWKAKPRQLTVCEIVNEVKADICDKYCRYPRQMGEDGLEDICDGCPLNRL